MLQAMAEASNATARTSEGGGEGGVKKEKEAQPTSEGAGVNSRSPSIAQAADKTIKKEDELCNTHTGPDAKSFDSPKLLNRVMYRIPSYAGWFSWGKIHSVEQRALPEFFDGKSLSKTPKVYKEYRDFIINKYRENPQRSLTFTEVRKMLVGDVNLIRKVFDCIEYWDLINNQIAPENKQQAVTAESVHSSFISETIPPGVRIMYPCKIRQSKVQLEPDGEPAGMVSSSNLASHRDLFAKLAAMDESTVAVDESIDRLNPSSCSNCGVNGLEKWFENSKKEGSVLCETCFSAGDGYLRDDFILAEATSGSEMLHNEWTKEEVLRLLEAIAKHGENWDRVALHVGTKSKAECIMQFMKLPFGDQFRNSVGASHLDLVTSPHSTVEDVEKTVKTEQKDSSNGADAMELHENEELLESVEDADGPPTKRKRLNPPADSSNPILAQVAFMSAMVGPRVAAAAAQAALMAIAEEDPVAAQFLSPAQPVHKDSLLNSSSQAASKENVKAEEEHKEDIITCKEEHDVSRDAEIDTTSLKDQLPSVTQIRAAIATAIGAVGANAKLLADQEEREIEYLMAHIIENQLKKLDSKVQHFEELELLLDVEHSQVERTQVQVLADWIRFSHFNYSTGPA